MASRWGQQPMEVKVRGIDELKRELARLSGPVAQRLSRNAAMAGARIIARRAKELVPVRSGKLRASLKAMRPAAGQKAGQRVALAGSKVFYSRFIELGTSKAAARPFLRPAADNNAAEIRARIEDNLSRGIDREIAKQSVPEDPGDL
jgi:HK97 gp10 family phage protein